METVKEETVQQEAKGEEMHVADSRIDDQPLCVFPGFSTKSTPAYSSTSSTPTKVMAHTSCKYHLWLEAKVVSM